MITVEYYDFKKMKIYTFKNKTELTKWLKNFKYGILSISYGVN